MLECIRAILKWDIVDGIAKLNLCKSLTFGDTVDFMRDSEKYTFLMNRKDGFIGSTCHVINKLILRDNDKWISSLCIEARPLIMKKEFFDKSIYYIMTSLE